MLATGTLCFACGAFGSNRRSVFGAPIRFVVTRLCSTAPANCVLCEDWVVVASLSDEADKK